MLVLKNFKDLTDKCRKITEALYRVTDLMPEQEPLKWSLRERAMGIFSKITELKDIPIYKKARNLEEIIHSTSGILNFLELASAASFISQLNFEVLKREYLALVNFIEDRKEEFLPTEPVLIQPLPSNINSLTQANDKGHNRQNNKISAKEMSVKDDIDRKSKIIAILNNNKDWVSIKDIIFAFKDVGPKTVQRELSAMISEGLLKTIGEKRWRKYALKTN
ncbi:MAG: hypothetical protein UU71_C0040G0003 [Parcubacteria group bacterium GW2011_GWB1_41_6]|nr:MAG: hypothetical protein UU71_C0040G0003 [Parcubacteria group bacterium GW2011_GWB1_41_6]KKS56892.1 MAG: hypothetical protein UV22_C0024G0007 [Parcubacteria group bacterium GW2011_GWA2_42_35]KKS70419.1 MAG: hypothetical protein UV43_C0064G0005 [Parcubacteria group bacterium GW2011_GWF2_42_7]